MNGRLEKELRAEGKMKDKLEQLPLVFTEFYFALDGAGKSYTTINNYINHNIEFMNYVTQTRPSNTFYQNVKSIHVNQYMASLRRKMVDGNVVRLGDDIRAARWSSINAFFMFLKNYEYIAENPVEKTNRPQIKTEHKVTYLTTDEISQVLSTIKSTATAKKLSRDLCIVSLALSTGLRVSAITQINISDVDLINNTISVIEKGNKVRTIPFGNNLHQLLTQYLADRSVCFSRISTEALFVSQWGKRMTDQAVRDLVKKYTTNITNKHITPHKLRASAATNLAASGTSIQTIAKILGHENIQTTRRYVEVLEKETASAVKTLDNLI